MRNKVTDVGFKVKYLFVYFNNLCKLLFFFYNCTVPDEGFASTNSMRTYSNKFDLQFHTIFCLFMITSS